jgi:hypothetical protein
MRVFLLSLAAASLVSMTAAPAASSNSIQTAPLVVTGQGAAAATGSRVRTVASAAAAPATAIPAGAVPPAVPPGGPPPVKPPVSGATSAPKVTIALDVPVQLTTINAGASVPITRVLVWCAVASSPAVHIGTLTGANGVASISGIATGSGLILHQATKAVPLDQNGSYAGPPIHVTVDIPPRYQSTAAKSYACALVFNRALADNQPTSNGGSQFAQSPFTVNTQGTLP